MSCKTTGLTRRYWNATEKYISTDSPEAFAMTAKTALVRLTDTQGQSDPFDEGPPVGIKRFFRHRSRQYLIAPILLVLVLVPLADREGYHLVLLSGNLIKTATVFTLLALGASLVLATSHIDLSSTGVASMSGVLFALILSRFDVGNRLAIPFSAVAALVFAAASGSLVAFCFLKLRPPLLIFTWSLGAIYNILTILLTKLAPHPDVSGVALPWRLPDDMWHFGKTAFWVSILATVVAMIAVAAINLPQRAQALGASETSAVFAGVSRPRTLTECFIINALLSGAAGILHTFYLSQASTGDLVGKELTPIAIAVLGGTALSGGYLSMWSVVAASLFWAGTRLLGPHLPPLLPALAPIQAELGQILFYAIFLLVSLLFGSLLAPRFPKIFARRED